MSGNVGQQPRGILANTVCAERRLPRDRAANEPTMLVEVEEKSRQRHRLQFQLGCLVQEACGFGLLWANPRQILRQAPCRSVAGSGPQGPPTQFTKGRVAECGLIIRLEQGFEQPVSLVPADLRETRHRLAPGNSSRPGSWHVFVKHICDSFAERSQAAGLIAQAARSQES